METKQKFQLVINYKSGSQKIFKPQNFLYKVEDTLNKIKNKSNIFMAYVVILFYNTNNQPYMAVDGEILYDSRKK